MSDDRQQLRFELAQLLDMTPPRVLYALMTAQESKQ
jgi:hypothetical protein